jgi:hypothetical protein
MNKDGQVNKKQERIIEKLLSRSRNEEFTQFILRVIGESNWTRGMLSNCPQHLTHEQTLLYESLGGGYSEEEVDEGLYNVEVDYEIREKLKEQGVTKFLYENDEYIEEIREGRIICEGIDVEEIKTMINEQNTY